MQTSTPGRNISPINVGTSAQNSRKIVLKMIKTLFCFMRSIVYSGIDNFSASLVIVQLEPIFEY